MTELQKKLIEMLEYFHALCEKEGLRYYLLGGTALGAARHGGFIPWDDDIDVGMPRGDYERLRKLSGERDFGKFCFEYPSERKDFVYPYGKMYDMTTTLVESTRYKTKRGIFIDIFPLDASGDTYEQSVENFRKIKRKVNLLSSMTCAWRRGRALYKNLSTVAAKLIPGFIVCQEKLKADIDNTAKQLDYDKCGYIANFFGNWGEKEIAEKGWFGTPTLCDFDGIKAFGPENIDAYLTALYGDWRTPPPPEKQVTHHDFILLDLNTPYINGDK